MDGMVPIPIDPWDEIERLKHELEASQRREIDLVARLARQEGQIERRRHQDRFSNPERFSH